MSIGEDCLDIGYRTIDSPLGALLLAATPRGLLRVAFANEGHDAVLHRLEQRISPRVRHVPGRLDAAARQVEEYFAGRRRNFELALDWRLTANFQRIVLKHLINISYGQTASYATMAAAVGNPTAVRGVGNACATNPLPVVLPCHRVIRSDGSVGGYLGGERAKQALLTLEAAA